MGCDIHLITQIKKQGKWEYVPESPKTLEKRNYFNFAILADVRNDFDTKGFNAKGLPADLEEKQFGWKSELENIKNYYNTLSETKCKLPDGSYISEMDESIKRFCTEEEYNAWKGTKGRGKDGYYVYDAKQVGGEFVKVPDNQLYSFEAYLNEYHSDEYNEQLKDYGRYKVDFDCEDLHTPSYLTLKEIKEFDYTDILREKVKVSKYFIDKFLNLGGELPKGMYLTTDWQPQDIRDCFRQAIDPVYIISWDSDSKKESLDFFKGVSEIEEIANKYDIQNFEDIRIVFAFDN